MAPKRTRSVTQRLAESKSFNVPDHMGPSKRQKRVLEEGGEVGTEQLSPARVTRSGTVRRKSSKQKPTLTTSQARQPPGNEGNNDEDEEVNVNFNTVVFVSNEARRTRPQTVNGVRIAEMNSAPNSVASDGENNKGPYDENANYEGEDEPGDRSTTHSLRIHPVRTLNSGSAKRPSQLAEQYSRRLSNDDKARGDLYEFMPSPEAPANQSSPKTAHRGIANTRKAPTPRSKARMQHDSKKRSTEVGTVEPDDKGPESEEGIGEDVTVGVGEDSAFIEAPRPDENLATVSIIVNSMGGMIKTLAHAAWTGNSKWDASFDTARGGIRDDVEQCRTGAGRRLMKHLRALMNIFDNAAASAMHEEEGDDDYKKTMDYLRDQSNEVGGHLAGIDKLVEMICTDGLATSSDLAREAIKARRSLLRDLAKRLIPMMIIMIQTVRFLGPSEERGGKLHLQFSSFTLQFFLRTVGWAGRLQKALARGLEQWPFDEEFRNDRELDGDQIRSKKLKQQSRDTFRKQLLALHDKAKEAARAMQKQIREPARQLLQRRRRQRQLVREKALSAAQETFQAEESRRAAERWLAFCQSTQALREASDPMKEKWDTAERARFTQPATRPPNLQERAQHAPRGVHTSSRTLLARNAQGNANGAFPPEQPWGLDWTETEERTLVRAIRYHRDYDPISMAMELRRSQEDVARKAAALKKAYRSMYRERGRQIPGWAK